MARTLRLILGDQLNAQHSWYAGGPEKGIVYVMLELRQETDYAEHHVQKVMAYFAAMRGFATWLQEQGHTIEYLHIHEPQANQSLAHNLARLAKKHKATHLGYQLPDELRLDEQLRGMANRLGLIAEPPTDTEHFLTTRQAVSDFFSGKKTFLMESFYRRQRVANGWLMEPNGQPVGGQWNFDHDNRQALPAGAEVPPPRFEHKDFTDIHTAILKAGIETMGTVEAPSHFIWPVSRPECLRLLDHFAAHALPRFGQYEDAMHSRHWLIYHSRLSFAMNSKQLSPREVIERCIAEQAARPEEISLAQIEGFVRQIVGWREYMRGIYWAKMPAFGKLNYFGNTRPLPSWYWTGQTYMRCLSHSLGQSLEKAYAHHIQRLMVIGNFAMLIGADPDSVDAWYLGVYIDALEWVEITNTRGMSQFADGGIVGTKPYAGSAAYINKMSDYCGKCFYAAKLRHGERACPFNSLYWDFYARNRAKLEGNPRIGMAYKTWDRFDEKEQKAILTQASYYLEKLEEL